jgi:hypothetical protein
VESKNLSQVVGVATHITPAAARAASTYVTPAVEAKNFSRLLGILHIGTLAGNASISMKFQHNSVSTSNDGNWADINSTSCVTAVYGSANNDKLPELELRIDQNPATSRYVRAYVSLATSTWIGGVTVLGNGAKYNPITDVDSADVVATTVY